MVLQDLVVTTKGCPPPRQPRFPPGPHHGGAITGFGGTCSKPRGTPRRYFSGSSLYLPCLGKSSSTCRRGTSFRRTKAMLTRAVQRQPPGRLRSWERPSPTHIVTHPQTSPKVFPDVYFSQQLPGAWLLIAPKARTPSGDKTGVSHHGQGTHNSSWR